MGNDFFHFDFGNLLTIVSFVAVLYKFHSENTKKVNRMELKINLMWQEFCKRFGIKSDLGLEDE